MFERILLPLDGSQLAEMAIPYGEELAGRLDSEMVLLHVCPSQYQPFSHMHEIYLDSMVSTIQRQIKKKFPRCEECQVRAEVISGEPADVICDYVQKNEIGLIVLSTHGVSGFKVWMLGSVVDKVVRTVNIPILLIRVKESRPVEGKKRLISRILLPLDGSDVSKIAVPYAVELAKRLKASITLFQMAQKTSPYATREYSSTGWIPDWVRADAVEERRVRTYLIEVARDLRREGIPVKHAVTLGTDSAGEILEQERRTKADLVVMATRARSPIVRWISGSVAEKVLRRGELPLLAVRKISD